MLLSLFIIGSIILILQLLASVMPKGLIGVGICLLAAILVAPFILGVGAFIIQLLANFILVPVFGFAPLTFLQAVALKVVMVALSPCKPLTPDQQARFSIALGEIN